MTFAAVSPAAQPRASRPAQVRARRQAPASATRSARTAAPPRSGCPAVPSFRSRCCRPSLRSGPWRWSCPGRCRRSGATGWRRPARRLRTSARAAAAGMPMPVSMTVKRRRTLAARRRCASATSSRTEPSSVNLIALPARLISTWRTWLASPTRRSGTSGATCSTYSMRLLRARRLQDRADAVEQFAHREFDGVQLELAGLDRGDVEHVLDQRQQRARRGLDGVEAFALLGVQARGGQQFRHARQAVERRAELVAHVGEEAALRLVRAARFLGRAGQRAQQARTGTAAPRSARAAGRGRGCG